MTLGKKKVLLVEDEIFIAKIEMSDLTQKGYEILHALNGEDAVSIACDPEKSVDLILMDINLGKGIDGTQAAEEILKCKEIPIVFLSSHTDPEIVGKTERITSYGYVVKNSGIVVLDASIKMAFKLFEAKQKINSEQDRISTILSGIADTFYSLDNDWRFTMVNPAASKAPFGKPAKDMIGRIIWDLYPNLVGTEIYKHYLDAAINFSLEHYEAQSPLNGRWYEVFMQGWKGGVDVYMRDITDRRHAIEAMRESEEKYRLLHESAGIGIGYYTLDGKVISFNKIAAQNMGGVPEDYTGKSIYEIFSTKEADFYFDRIKKAALSDENEVYEDCIPLPSGNKYFLSTFTKIINSKNDLQGIQIISQEITAQRIAEKEKLESEKKYQMLIENVNMGVFQSTFDGRFIHANSAIVKMCGYGSIDEFKNVSAYELYADPEDRENLIAGVKENGVIHNKEMRSVKKDGTIYWISMNVVMIKDINGIPSSIIGCIQDITERKQTEENLRERMKELYCLYTLSDIIEKYDSVEPVLRESVDIIPRGWFYPETACVRILWDKREFKSANFRNTSWCQTADIIVLGKTAGIIELCYLEEHQPRDEGPFLHQERILINAIAERFGRLIERKQVEEELNTGKTRLELALSAARAGTWDWDIINNELVWDDQMYHLYGIGKNVFDGAYEAWLSAIHPEDRAECDEVSLQARKGLREYDTEFRIILSDKSIRIIKAKGLVLRDTAGYPVRMIGINYDITDRKKVENELIESRELFASFINYSPIYAYIKSVKPDESRVIYASENFIDMTGIKGSDMTGKRMDEVFPAEFAKKITEDDWNVVSQGKILKLDENLGDKKYLTYKFPIVQNSRKLLAGYTIDITDIKRNEEALRESEMHFRSILENTDAGYFFIDSEGIIRDVNNAWIRLYKYESREEIIGKHFAEIQKTGDMENANEVVRRIMEGDSHYLNGEFSRKCKDDTIGYHTFSAKPVVRSGNTVGIEGIIFDITERRMLEESKRKSETLFQSLFESMIEGVALHELIYDINDMPVDYMIINVNRSFSSHTGIKKEMILGKKATEAYDTESAPYIDVYSRVIITGTPETFETYFQPMNKYFIISVFKIRDDQFATVFEDITERKQADETIKRQLSEKEILLKEVHHRIKNNIATIESLLRLQAGSISNTEAQSILNKVIGRIGSIRLIYDRLLLSDDYREISVKYYLEELIMSIIDIFSEKEKISVNMAIDDFQLNVKSLFSLGTIINELITNSMKYAFTNRKNGVITVLLSKIGNDIVLTVSDDGIGFPENFDAVKSSRFGLTLINMFVEGLKGSFEMENRNGIKCILKFTI